MCSVSIERQNRDKRPSKRRVTAALAGIFTFACAVLTISADARAADQCVNIYHDESSQEDAAQGPVNAIFLANLLGHWPQFEVRVTPIEEYGAGDAAGCAATFYIGTDPGADVPEAFLWDFFASETQMAWVGFGSEKLDQTKFERAFGYQAVGELGIAGPNAENPGFYEYVTYKGQVFQKDSFTHEGRQHGAFRAVEFALSETATTAPTGVVVAELIHNETFETQPYMLRSANKFVVADVPFTYMHEGGRYFAFADLLFDVLKTKPLRDRKLAFVRLEDIHGKYDRETLDAAIGALRSEQVPVSIAHIPLLMDPHNALGNGPVTEPLPAAGIDSFRNLIRDISQDPRNAVIWHGVTHQHEAIKNPHSGASGDDYEFWDMTKERPIDGESIESIVTRLQLGLDVFDAYDIAPRYWVSPHYRVSAMTNRVIGASLPWVVGRVTYFTSSVGQSFSLPAVSAHTGERMPSVSKDTLAAVLQEPPKDLDTASLRGNGQLFPFEIYRDIYGQRVIPETLGYVSTTNPQAVGYERNAADMLADADRNSVIRDYWASFFFHPYLLGVTRGEDYYVDATLLRQIVVGLKQLGYEFVGLPEFERSVRNRSLN